jgi:hypothetical protein
MLFFLLLCSQYEDPLSHLVFVINNSSCSFPYHQNVKRGKGGASDNITRGGFLKYSTTIVAQLSQIWTNSFSSSNSFAALETCTPSMVSLSQDLKDVTQLLLTLSNEILDSLCKSNLRNPKRTCKQERCFWHKNKRDKSKKLWEEENKHVSPPELPNTGSQHQKRGLSSEPLDHLNME